MGKQHLIGVDLGSSSVKATVFDLEGRALAETRRANRPVQPRAGVAEYNGDAMVNATLEAIKDALTQCPTANVAAICMDGMISGTMGVDADGNATTPYTTPLDMRFAPHLNRAMDRYHDPIREKTGSGMAVIGPKIMWIRDEYPAVYARTARFVTAVGYVAGKMAGLRADHAFLDFTYLWTTGLSDTLQYRWSEELCREMGVPVGLLPRIVKPTDIVGEVGATAAAATGLTRGTPIVAGAGDQSAGFVGAGLTRINRAADVAGTYPVLAVSTDKFEPDMTYRAIEVFPSPVPGVFNPCSIINGGGLTHRWFGETFGHGEEAVGASSGVDHTGFYARLDRLASHVPRGSEKLLFNPHLGGRMCPVQTNLKGAWLGFTWSHSKEHFYRAVLEGIAYDHAIAFQHMQELYPTDHVDAIRVFGGGARSNLWNQIKTDVLGLPYVALEHEDLATLGDAIIAGCALGIYDDMSETAERFARPRKRYSPSDEGVSAYRPYVKAYERFLETIGPAYDILVEL